MKRTHTLVIGLILLAGQAFAQTPTTYRGLTVLADDPTGAAALAIQENFKELADRLGNHFEVAGEPTPSDDQANTAGNGPAMYLSTWRNAVDQTLWICLDATTQNAYWIPVPNVGSVATQDSDAVAITGGTVTGITDLAIADGGTGASDMGGARANLGLGTMATESAAAISSDIHLLADGRTIYLGAADDASITYSAGGYSTWTSSGGFYLATDPIGIGIVPSSAIAKVYVSGDTGQRAIYGVSDTVTAVEGLSESGYGVLGRSTSNHGLVGQSTTHRGVSGNSSSGVGGYFTSTSGYGLQITSNTNHGFYAESRSTIAGKHVGYYYRNVIGGAGSAVVYARSDHASDNASLFAGLHNGTGNLLDLQNASGSQFTVDHGGNLTATNMTVGEELQAWDTDLDVLAAAGTAGDILYHNGTTWVKLPKGTAGQVLTMNAGATAPEWATP